MLQNIPVLASVVVVVDSEDVVDGELTVSPKATGGWRPASPAM
jgi:hypothetical protein